MKKNILGYLLQDHMEPIGKTSPFNEIDGMVFAIFSYAPTGNDVRHCKPNLVVDPIGMTIGEFSEILIDTEDNDILTCRFGTSSTGDYGQHLRFFKNISRSQRYRDIKITGFSCNNDGYCQFCAYTFQLADGEYLIAYRGTDGSLEGWYESYKMFNYDVPSQQLALQYFKQELHQKKGIYRLVGHSKGGNLAMAAGVLCSTQEKLSLRSILNYDGPGFSPDFIKKNKKSILLTQHKAYRFSPEDAMVSALLFGQDLLYYKKNIRYVKPYGIQLPTQQHLYFNWALNQSNRFEPARQSKLSLLFQEHMAELFTLHSPEEIEEIFEDIFTDIFNMHKKTESVLSAMDVMSMFLNARMKLASLAWQADRE